MVPEETVNVTASTAFFLLNALSSCLVSRFIFLSPFIFQLFEYFDEFPFRGTKIEQFTGYLLEVVYERIDSPAIFLFCHLSNKTALAGREYI